MNHPFVQSQAEELTRRVWADSADVSSLPEQQRGHSSADGLPPHFSARLARAYRLLFSRTPTAEETAIAADFLRGGPIARRASRVGRSNPDSALQQRVLLCRLSFG